MCVCHSKKLHLRRSHHSGLREAPRSVCPCRKHPWTQAQVISLPSLKKGTGELTAQGLPSPLTLATWIQCSSTHAWARAGRLRSHMAELAHGGLHAGAHMPIAWLVSLGPQAPSPTPAVMGHYLQEQLLGSRDRVTSTASSGRASRSTGHKRTKTRIPAPGLLVH